MPKTRVLIVDDSAVVRSVINEMLSADADIEVVGEAVDPYDARDKIKQLRPDVLTLDVEMPKMDGITFLRNLMKLNPMPVVMLSTLTQEGAEVTLQALELGAVDFIGKPMASSSDSHLESFQTDLISKVKAAASASQKLRFRRTRVEPADRIAAPALSAKGQAKDQFRVVAVGSSTGGTEALRDVLIGLPTNMPPIVVTQHIPASFSERFANRLNTVCDLTVKEAQDGDVLETGHVYIAPGDQHLKIRKQGLRMMCRLDDSGPVNRHQPSVEVLFNSLMEIAPANVTALMLTGMGEDGAKAMKSLADAGAHTIVQDEASSLVWGMPGAAVKYGAAKDVVALQNIAKRLMQHLNR
ncbi:protein-glutamate methylesterase/protein-glutamine glutaminase [Aliamphritea ceti]|uniref:protein-glutamate methylesterase/protein-glutamine glutaminase n=1 Tax=Aliamphritea ceti TaxID=1524258 RepID=UPI0021C4BFCD|nr:chemotaxis response regulator protein-glutamate methylesterase [Aliamphritea ceti]